MHSNNAIKLQKIVSISIANKITPSIHYQRPHAARANSPAIRSLLNTIPLCYVIHFFMGHSSLYATMLQEQATSQALMA